MDDANIETPTVTPSANTTYTVTVTDENGCTVSDEVSITLEQLTFADAGSDQTICNGGSADLVASGGVSYVWDDPSGATTAAVTVAPTSTTTYTVTVTDADGCIDTDQVVVTVVPAPVVTVTDDQICPDETATLTSTITGGSGTVTYQWQKSHGGSVWSDIAGATSADYTTPPLIGTSYYRLVTTWSGTGCGEVNSNTGTVTVDQESQVTNLVAGEDTLCLGESTILTVNDGNLNGGEIDYSSWTLGTGSTTGFYRTGVDDENNRINGTDPWGNSTVVWEAQRTDVNRNDGGWNTSRFPVDHSQMYRFSVWINRKVIGTSGRDYLGTRGYGSIDGVARITTGVITTNPYFEASNNPPTAYGDDQWILLVGHVYPSNTTSTSLHADSGIYSLCDGKLENIGMDYKWLLIDGTEPSLDDLLYGFDTTNGLGDGATYEWFTGSCGGTSVGTGQTLTVTPTTTTTYYVRATGTCSTTDCQEVTIVVNDPVVTLNDTEVCIDESIELSANATGEGELTYTWSPAGTLDDATSATPIATPTATTTYTVTVTDENGCTVADDVIVTQLDSTAVFCERYRVRGEDDVWGAWMAMTDCTIEICEMNGLQDIQFDGGPDIDTGWVWTDEDGNTDSEVDEEVIFENITIDDSGTYTGMLTNADGCPSEISFDVVVNPSIIATASVTSDDLCEDGSGEATVNIQNGNGPFTINWVTNTGLEPGSGTIPATGDYVIPNLNGGTTYCIEVTDSNGCQVVIP